MVKRWTSEEMRQEIAHNLAENYKLTEEQALQMYDDLKPVITIKEVTEYLRQKGWK